VKAPAAPVKAPAAVPLPPSKTESSSSSSDSDSDSDSDSSDSSDDDKAVVSATLPAQPLSAASSETLDGSPIVETKVGEKPAGKKGKKVSAFLDVEAEESGDESDTEESEESESDDSSSDCKSARTLLNKC
jgi:nucleolin